MKSMIAMWLGMVLAVGAADVMTPLAVGAADVMTPLDLRQVKLGGEFERRIDLLVTNRLVHIDYEKTFLTALRQKTGYGYFGFGKPIDFGARLGVYTGNARLLELKKHFVDEVLKTQEPDGYIGAIVPKNRIWGLWDACEMGYIIQGLVSDYKFCGEKRSLEAAVKLAAYMMERWHTKPAGWAPFGHYESEALVGFYRTWPTLYAATGDKRYLDFCVNQLKVGDWDIPIEIGRRAGVKGHAYAFLSQCLAQVELYRFISDEKLLAQTRKAVEFMTQKNGMTIIGGVGETECWTDDQDGRGQHAETCATVYNIFLFDSLLRLKGESFYGDLIERLLYNAAFGAQSPDGQWSRYWNNFEGSNRFLISWDHYCCPNNLRRLFALLPQLIYYRTADGVAVNLYNDSQATLSGEDGLQIALKQETDYPTSGKVVLRLEPSRPARFALQLRIPRWCKTATVTVNGQPAETTVKPGEFCKLTREWKAGDTVTLELPMEFRFVLGRQRQAGRAAVMRGPLVYTLNPSQEKAIAQSDGADLTHMLVTGDKPVIEPVIPDASVRPGGTACRLSLKAIGYHRLKLTEYPDVKGACIYFRLRDLGVAVPDELLTGP